MKAIETEFAGYRFRSRLEAKWAVVFDRMGYEWEYEPSGYEVHEGFCGYVDPTGETGPKPDDIKCEHYRYLPDFYLPHFGLWVEVKGRWTATDLRKVTLAANDSRGGLPLHPDGPSPNTEERNAMRVLLLGDIPSGNAAHWALRFHKGVISLTEFCFPTCSGGHNHHGGDLDLWDDGGGFISGIDRVAQVLNDFPNASDSEIYGGWPEDPCWSPIRQAYSDGRQARFEHGETPDRKSLIHRPRPRRSLAPGSVDDLF